MSKTVIMKYNTISTSSLSSEGKTATLTIYTDNRLTQAKVASTENEVATIRGELELVHRALKLQTRRCRQLVAEYTKRLQLKEKQYQAEKRLRDDQLAKVLRALLVFEARLRQEQKFISHQLGEKDYIIKKQQTDIQKLLSSHYCKNYNQLYNPTCNLESLDSSSEYVHTVYNDYQSSNFESLDSSSEAYASISEKDKAFSVSSEDIKSDTDPNRNFIKNKNKDFLNRRNKRIGHRKSVGNYFDVLKMRTDNNSPSSNEENTSNDYEHFDSLPSENMKNINLVSDRIEQIFAESRNKFEDHSSDSVESGSNTTTCNVTVIVKDGKELSCANEDERNESKISETIPVFDGDGDGGTNDNWYASASDPEDEEQRDVYRNNPVLECMNQILMQNINDPPNSPPKTPNMEKKANKNNKRVKFSDEEDNKSNEKSEDDYYETPIQKTPNFYETPQSIYSNDYEQVLNQCNQSFSLNELARNQKAEDNVQSNKISDGEDRNHYYVDMDTKSEKDEKDNKIVRKSKILRTPPALPPKPANLISKYKIQNIETKDRISEKSLDSEPDYCSISEINLPTEKTTHFTKVVVAEINSPPSDSVHKRKEKSFSDNISQELLSTPPQYKPVSLKETIPLAAVRKSLEKLDKSTPKATSTTKIEPAPRKTPTADIPKLPQVTEIIIPDENEKPDECINQDNYVKNNTQMKKVNDRTRPIQIGSSVSSLIASFNNKQLLSEIKRPPLQKSKKIFSSFENLVEESSPKQDSFEKFDLSQNFEEFKLDDCEIGDYDSFIDDVENRNNAQQPNNMNKQESPAVTPRKSNSSTCVEIIRATNNIIPQLNVNSIQLLKKKLEIEKNKAAVSNHVPTNNIVKCSNEPTYEHFLECTGLSSKSILTPTRLLSNHKSMLKPKDIKLRSKAKANIFERQGSTVRYWSEPYL